MKTSISFPKNSHRLTASAGMKMLEIFCSFSWSICFRLLLLKCKMAQLTLEVLFLKTNRTNSKISKLSHKLRRLHQLKHSLLFQLTTYIISWSQAIGTLTFILPVTAFNWRYTCIKRKNLTPQIMEAMTSCYRWHWFPFFSTIILIILKHFLEIHGLML